MAWELWWPAIASSGTVGALLAGTGIVLKEATVSAIRNKFNGKIERLRGDIRSTEQRIDALRAGALATLSARHEAIDKRRMQAIESLWRVTIQQARFRFVVSAMQYVNVAAISDASPHEREKLKPIGEMLVTASGIENVGQQSDSTLADVERIFVPASAWAAFSALRSIYAHAIAYAAAIKAGAPVSIIKNTSETNALVKLVLPHQEPFLEKYPDSAIFFLTGELEELIFKELVSALNMPQSDQELVSRASAIVQTAEGLSAKAAAEIPDTFRADAKAAAAFTESLRK